MYSIQIMLLYLPSQIRSPIGGERVTCHGSKLTNSPGKQQLELRLARDQVVHLETASNLWKICANLWKIFIICSIFELGGMTNHLMTDPSGNLILFPPNLN